MMLRFLLWSLFASGVSQGLHSVTTAIPSDGSERGDDLIRGVRHGEQKIVDKPGAPFKEPSDPNLPIRSVTPIIFLSCASVAIGTFFALGRMVQHYGKIGPRRSGRQ